MASRDDKDTAMDGLLRRSFAGGTRDDVRDWAKECPSAETLAAYYERTLDDAERARYEVHFSTCGRCREQLAVLLRADESVSSGAAGKTAGGWSWFTNQWWLVPVAGTLVIGAVVYFGVMPRMHKFAATQAEVAMSKAEPPTDRNVAPPPVPKAAPAAAPLASDMERLKAQTEEVTRSAVNRKKARTQISGKSSEQPQATDTNSNIEKDEAKAGGVPEQPARTARGATTATRAGTPTTAPARTATGAAGARHAVRGGFGSGRASSAPVSPAAKGAAPAAPGEAAQPQISQQSQAVEVTGAAPPVNTPSPTAPPAPTDVQEKYSDADKQDAKKAQELPPSRTAADGVDQPTSRVLARTKKEADEATPGQPNAASKSKPGARMLKAQPAAATLTVAHAEAKVISSPDSQSLWRIAEGGFVEHSENGGTSWTGTQPAPDAQWTAGSAPAARTCWFVGRGGMIVVTTDAVHWKIVPPPSPADFADVTATNGREAVVTTADGRKFSTHSAGKTWQQTP